MPSTRPLTRQEAEDFLYREARLLDEGRLEEWLGLFTEDGCYWVPENGEGVDPDIEMSIAHDDRERLEARVYRLLHTPVHGQIPASRTRRFVTNVEVECCDDGEVTVYGSFIIYEVRKNEQRSLAGRSQYRLRREGDHWKIALKKADLVNNDCPLFNLTFII